MAVVTLRFARLIYGSRLYPIKPSVHLPIPETFDFENPIECAKTIFAIMSNACGGHTIRRCELRTDQALGMANLTGIGVHVYYAPLHHYRTRNIDDVMHMILCTKLYSLGNVSSDQYGDGWKRAIWTEQA
jgi:hypothetical protein